MKQFVHSGEYFKKPESLEELKNCLKQVEFDVEPEDPHKEKIISHYTLKRDYILGLVSKKIDWESF